MPIISNFCIVSNFNWEIRFSSEWVSKNSPISKTLEEFRWKHKNRKKFSIFPRSLNFENFLKAWKEGQSLQKFFRRIIVYYSVGWKASMSECFHITYSFQHYPHYIASESTGKYKISPGRWSELLFTTSRYYWKAGPAQAFPAP